jgi:hypothetical protein
MSHKTRQRIEHRERTSLGADVSMRDRPGVPMEQPLQTGAHWQTPERQRPVPWVTKRAELKQLTPVFSTAYPPRGVSGVLRRAAYSLPETHARHYMMLLLADRVDLMEHRIAKLVKVMAFVPVGVAALVLGAKLLKART